MMSAAAIQQHQQPAPKGPPPPAQPLRQSSLHAVASRVPVTSLSIGTSAPADSADRRRQQHQQYQQRAHRQSNQAATSEMFVPRVRLAEDSVNPRVLGAVSADLKFDESVVKERCSHTLPYSDALFADVYSPGSVLPHRRAARAEQQQQHFGLRCGHKGPNFRWPQLRQKEKEGRRLEPLTAPAQRASTGSPANQQQQQQQQTQKSSSGGIFLTEGVPAVADSRATTATKAATEAADCSGRVSGMDTAGYDWDDYVLRQLHPNTAAYVAREAVHNPVDRRAYVDRLKRWYGQAPPDLVDLVPDRPDLTEYPPVPSPDHYLLEATADEARRKLRRNSNAFRLSSPFLRLLDDERSREAAGEAVADTDPYGEANRAAFYRLPLGSRKRVKEDQAVSDDHGNSTAAAISSELPAKSPLPQLKDSMNPRVGDKCYTTDNDYERERLSGVKLVHQPGNQKELLLQNYNRYTLQLAQQVPDEQGDGAKPKRGMRKWIGLPLAQDPTQHLNKLGSEEEDYEEQRRRLESSKRKRNDEHLHNVVDEWRRKWHLNSRYGDCTVEDLLRDMADVHPTIRLQAVLTCAHAQRYVAEADDAIHFDESAESATSSQLPQSLMTALELLLDDQHAQVRHAAAICLYQTNKPTPRAEALLRDCLVNGSGDDRWAAVQCLAGQGDFDSDVIGALVHELMTNEDTLRHHVTTQLLASLSQHTPLVHGLLAEQLNSPSWRRRVIVCKTLPTLNGSLNRDLAQKLSHLMWNDSHKAVRRSAAKALGQTGHGKDVHDDILRRLRESGERIRADAVEKLGLLGVMTGRLMSAFLACFDDQYASVRIAACVACSRLRIRDEQCVRGLLRLAAHDPWWKVKARAIQAIGLIGLVSTDVAETLLWAARFEPEERVRATAVRTIALQLRLRDEPAKQALRDRLLVEKSPLVLEQLRLGLQAMGLSPTADGDTVAQIKEAVRKLDEKGRICREVMEAERAEEFSDLHQRMIPKSPSPLPPIQQQEQQTEAEPTEAPSSTVQFSRELLDDSQDRDITEEQDDDAEEEEEEESDFDEDEEEELDGEAEEEEDLERGAEGRLSLIPEDSELSPADFASRPATSQVTSKSKRSSLLATPAATPGRRHSPSGSDAGGGSISLRDEIEQSARRHRSASADDEAAKSARSKLSLPAEALKDQRARWAGQEIGEQRAAELEGFLQPERRDEIDRVAAVQGLDFSGQEAQLSYRESSDMMHSVANALVSLVMDEAVEQLA
ncbi:hypothetical protein BOX15_Mlig000186g3 [Macrostomum lignano]|uniref:Uncharacterized protein n=1 Tax=Macrostomum lignano TaxID=282301 RepID=A0A267GKD8_9PLAT|nr:hypothetical protein BOX15_Mlig000186g3 [Macrostomum lignano]